MIGPFRNPRRNGVGSRHRLAFNGGFPTKELLLAKVPPKLSENKLNDSYNSVSEYLDVHFDLLLEDFMCPLRGALQKFNRKSSSATLNGARVYHNVTLKRLKYDREITCEMKVDKSKGTTEPSFGGLLVFTRRRNFDGDIFLAIVTSDTSKNDNVVKLRLKFPKGFIEDTDNLCFDKLIAIEGEAFFYVYFHVLKSLNKFNESNFPMKKYIVYGDKETRINPPAYLNRWTTYRIFGQSFEVLSNEWPLPKDLGIDNESQYHALKKALTEEIALIQGPPGTGKTYFGVSMVRVLLDNESVWNPSGSTPLLIICQSNQALDHFLEKLLPYTDKLVRAGDQCQSRNLQVHTLKELVCRNVCNYSVPGLSGLSTHLESLDRYRKQVKQLTQGIVSYKTLEKYGIISEEISSLFISEEDYLKWLGMHVKAESKSVSKSDTGLIVSIEELSQYINQLEVCGEYLLAHVLKEDVTTVGEIMAAFEGNFRQKVTFTAGTILELSASDAQNVYLAWMDKLSNLLNGKVEVQENQLNMFWQMLEGRQRHDATLKVAKSASVIGMTSTGAASRSFILEKLRCPIVIIEEAGELLESHVIVSMTQHCQHLIMMGDHKQLKPVVTTHHLARDFNLNLSLFERLLKNKVVSEVCLTTQYRMRPEISALLKPHIYSVLNDGPGTAGRPAVRGLSKSVFFLDHQSPEEKSADNTGFWNPYEVEMLINLAKYLVSMGYQTTEIAIIAMYSEQRNKLVAAREKIPALSNLQIASVDSFQGKENEIILVSLVRSNKTGNIGFLKEPNRVCVALSRARIGMYIVGNMKCLRGGGKMWENVSRRLKAQGSRGTALPLVCQTHKTAHRVTKPEHWETPFCWMCLLDKLDGKTTVIKPAKSIVRVASPVKTSRCSCCQSFYCDKVKDAVSLQPGSALDSLTLAMSSCKIRV